MKVNPDLILCIQTAVVVIWGIRKGVVKFSLYAPPRIFIVPDFMLIPKKHLRNAIYVYMVQRLCV